MRLLILIVSILLIPFGYWICDAVYLDRIELFELQNTTTNKESNPYNTLWWILRMDLLIASVSGLIITHFLSPNPAHEKYYKLVLYVGAGLMISDFVDRWFFNTRVITLTDLAVVAILLLFAYRKYLFKPRNNTYDIRKN